ncbi:hypothetical protein R1sor_002124 [Riccia sorocarpa]|uniref:Uncharacterized protein n=1 Tax=Riccia sorocarpa TaxID=122646 RepID=A0ABD3H0H6_9MARC
MSLANLLCDFIAYAKLLSNVCTARKLVRRCRPIDRVVVVSTVTDESNLIADILKMAAIGQELGVDDDWHKSYNRSHSIQQERDALSFETVSDTPILDETITIVKDKVWSFRAVPVGENDSLAERDEGEAALREVIDKEILGRSPFTRESEDSADQLRMNEERSLVHRNDDMDDTNHAFVETVRKDAEEMKSLTGRWMGELDEADEDDSTRRNF